MVVEFRVVPMGHHRSDDWNNRLWELIKTSGLQFEQGPMSVCVEGDWDKVINLIHRCHQAAFTLATHVLTSITVNELRQETTPMAETSATGPGPRFPRKGMDTEC